MVVCLETRLGRFRHSISAALRRAWPTDAGSVKRLGAFCFAAFPAQRSATVSLKLSDLNGVLWAQALTVHFLICERVGGGFVFEHCGSKEAQ